MIFIMEKHKIILIESEEGFAVSCPALKGCHSQGKTHEEALANIKDAIRDWLDAEKDEHAVFHILEEEILV
jgi:predicted RNase H-like HicB family nuclease